MVILSIRPGALNAFALRLRQDDTFQTIRHRIANKLALGNIADDDLTLKYEWIGVRYTLEDEDDWDIMIERANTTPEKDIVLYLSGPVIPTEGPFSGNNSSFGLPTTGYTSTAGPATTTNVDTGSILSGLGTQSVTSSSSHYRYGTNLTPSALAKKQPTVETIQSSLSRKSSNVGSIKSTATNRSRSSAVKRSNTNKSNNGSMASTVRRATAGDHPPTSLKDPQPEPEKPAHEVAFEKFHSQRGVRTFVGSIGPIENVRMMMKPGHRYCYMSREFAQQHGFIPDDAAPGYYGYSGLTNLGSWPIKVGEKTVSLQVMLVENSYFPIILGRSFAEKRRMKIDNLDQTHVQFMDTNETIPTDVVIVKDSDGNPLTVS